MRVLLPEPGETTVEEQVGNLKLGELAHDERPYAIVNFVGTLDGHATIAGRAGPIGSPDDQAMLHRLRTQVDAVMIGAGTMRTERYGRMVPDAPARAWRERIGLPHDPLAVIVSGRLDLPWDAEMFTCGEGRVLICTAADTDPPETETPVRVVRHEDRVDLAELMRYLRKERGVKSLLCEGGPHLHGQMVEFGLMDELFLTIAPKLADGGGPRILEGALSAVTELELIWLLSSGSELFARYRVTGSAQQAP